jgi:hypothetical protein
MNLGALHNGVPDLALSNFSVSREQAKGIKINFFKNIH